MKPHFAKILFFCSMTILFNHADCQEWRLYDESNSQIHDDYLQDVVIDRNGIVWVAGHENISSFDGLNWSFFEISNTYPNTNMIKDICLTNDNNLLIGTSNGLCLFSTKTKNADFSINLNIPFDWIESVAQTADGTIWVGEGVTGGRIASYSNGNWTSYQTLGISDQVIYSMDNFNNEIWSAVGNSVQKFENGSFISFNYGNSPIVSGQLVTYLAFDNSGKLWIDAPTATPSPDDYRLLMYDGSNWFEFEDLNCFVTENHISAIFPLDSAVWFATQGGGVVKLNYFEDSCFYYTQFNSIIPSDGFSGIAADSLNNICIATDNGLVIFNENKIILDAYKYADLSVYPNPFNDFLTLRFFSEDDQYIEFVLYNEIGEIVLAEKKQVTSGKIDLPVSIPDLSRGIYFASIIFNNSSVMKKLLKVD